MAKRILIIGRSGTGKSTAIRTLPTEETFIINVEGKDLPFKPKGYTKLESLDAPPIKGNLVSTHNVNTILKIMQFISDNRPEIKNIVLDDWQYIAMHQFIGKISEKGFEKFNILGRDIVNLASLPKTLREDLNVYYMTHQDTSRNEFTGEVEHKAKSFGKLVDTAVGGLEGLFSIVLYTEVVKTKEGVEHYFVTNNDGSTTAKTPLEMFDSTYIPNDLNLINDAINNFYK